MKPRPCTASVRVRSVSLFGAAMIAGGTLLLGSQAHAAVSAMECYKRFSAAKTGGTLNGQTYTAFKTANCSDDAGKVSSPLAQETGPAAAPGSSEAPAAPTPEKASRTATASASGAVFPTAVSSKYQGLSAGKARMKTCLDQYHANKGGKGNGGMNWIQKGGGYYSVCNARLKQ